MMKRLGGCKFLIIVDRGKKMAFTHSRPRRELGSISDPLDLVTTHADRGYEIIFQE